MGDQQVVLPNAIEVTVSLMAANSLWLLLLKPFDQGFRILDLDLHLVDHGSRFDSLVEYVQGHYLHSFGHE